MEAESGAKRTAASRVLKAARPIARRMEAAGDASTRAAPSPQKAHNTARRTAGAGGAKRRAVPRPLFKTARIIAGHTAGAGGASTWAAPRLLLQAARPTAMRMEVASGASRRAAPRQSLKLQAARSARCVCGPHSRSLTVRRRSNPQHTTCHSACASVRRSSGWWRTSHKPVHG